MASFGLSLAAFGSFLFISLAVFRVVNVRKTLHVLAAVFVVVLVASIAFAAAFMPGIDPWAFFAVYLCLFLIFVQVFAIFYKSISLRLILDVATRQGGHAPLDWVYAESIMAGSYHRRLAVLAEGGLIARQGYTIALTPKGAATARQLMVVQNVLGIENSG